MNRFALGVIACLAASGILMCSQRPAGTAHLGHPPDRALISRWDLTVLPNGQGLPPGSGTVARGKRIYLAKCAACHGDNGQGSASAPQLVGGFGSLRSQNPVPTVGDYWPYATTVWDYIHRAMPYTRPGSLSASDVYALTAYLLYRNGIIKKGAVMNRRSLPKVRMPNRDGFVGDPRPDLP